MIWLFISVISALVSLLLLAPLLSRTSSKMSDGLGAFTGQLAELERDQALDMISDAEAQSARLEINRRLLAASDSVEDNEAPSFRLRRITVLAMGLPAILAVAIYLQIGSPNLVANPPVARIEPANLPDDPTVLAAVDALIDRLAENPDDLEGWLLLGPYLMSTQQYGQAAIAFDRAISLAPPNADLFTAFGEAHLAANRGLVVPVARDAFENALELQPLHGRAQFFLALAWYQDGETARARESWTGIAQALPVGDPFRVMIEGQLDATRASSPGSEN
jgi:cytochrome c-type biogenesis protein CcmH